jgi:aspartate aminotransferase-like enzyme
VLSEKVRVVLNDIKEEGLENVFKRYNRLARATRADIEAMSLIMVVIAILTSATGCFVPEGLMMENWLKACGTI